MSRQHTINQTGSLSLTIRLQIILNKTIRRLWMRARARTKPRKPPDLACFTPSLVGSFGALSFDLRDKRTFGLTQEKLLACVPGDLAAVVSFCAAVLRL